MMEARRLERQRRLLAMRTAAPSLPSSQEEEFNLRLVDLYKEQPCLWNTSLPEHGDAELKRSAWEKIAAQMGSHLSAEFVRCRVRSMRYHLNVYKLQRIEYDMTPGVGSEPKKPFFVDRFAFLDANISAPERDAEPDSKPEEETDKYAKLLAGFKLKSLARRESGAGNPEERRSGPSIIGMVRRRLEGQLKPLEFTMPRLSISQMQRSMVKNRVLDQSTSASSLEVLSETPPALQALPGDSISKTKLAQKKLQGDRDSERPTTSRMASVLEDDNQSEDEELYSLHWSVRREQRSRRPGQDQRQKMPAGLRSFRSSEPTPDIF
ncbi:uncharacterized protein LOC108049826 [Drosophila rhopaloa]|uniref:Uncharacterized protein LOC108049826 n=1 Tax=Drosophila rhopaloa TaxID=1041015 RepID=A0A6P4FBZ4_DRORH|nr:uncharacterized protein LOC108049826 [Drosophila rhopaloa]